jgi:hypothetical protein
VFKRSQAFHSKGEIHCIVWDSRIYSFLSVPRPQNRTFIVFASMGTFTKANIIAVNGGSIVVQRDYTFACSAYSAHTVTGSRMVYNTICKRFHWFRSPHDRQSNNCTNESVRISHHTQLGDTQPYVALAVPCSHVTARSANCWRNRLTYCWEIRLVGDDAKLKNQGPQIAINTFKSSLSLLLQKKFSQRDEKNHADNQQLRPTEIYVQ